jgi:hypothetical protein
MPFPAIDLFRPIITFNPPFSVVFTDWLSTIAALGPGFRPIFILCQQKIHFFKQAGCLPIS